MNVVLLSRSAIFSLLLAFLPAFSQVTPSGIEGPRAQLSLDRGWRFHLGDASSAENDFGYGTGAAFAKAGEAVGAANPEFKDSSWTRVNIPHDWAVEQQFVRSDDDDVLQHGFKPVGRRFPQTTIGWYRRAFSIPASDAEKRIAIRFDGVFRDCIVWLNGHYLGRHMSGYGEFGYDVTDYIHYGGSNTLVLRVDASQYEGWFYEGAGIYRHTWLIKCNPLHIPEYGVYLKTAVSRDAASIDVRTWIENQGSSDGGCTVRSIVLDADGKPVASNTGKDISIPPGSQGDIMQTLQVPHPKLWSLESPRLYSLVSLLLSDGNVIDSVVTPFGIRTVRFDKDEGFFLNGRPVKIKGVCCHQDHAGVGSALPDRLQYYRIERLKEMGCNAYRTSHNPPTRELLDACDRLGMLVMDENRLLGSTPEQMNEWETLVRRDRNRACVILWSLGNEEFKIQSNDTGRRIALSMMAKLRELDPSRLCTFAANNGNHFEGINSVVPVRGFNYLAVTDIDKYRRDHPGQVLLGSEEASTVSTRGIYANDTSRGYVCDYDSVAPNWGATAERWWKFYVSRTWLCGAFVWTGFDYRGEPTPYRWPCINSHFGIMDVCGFPKNNYYYYQSWWSDRDVLHIFPHWNWHTGDRVAVWAQTNCDSVELSLNGTSLGRQQVPRNGHVAWSVTFVPGSLEARGWRGSRVLVDRRETTGATARLILKSDRGTIRADGEDVSVVTVTALDRSGKEVPVADDVIRFSAKGVGSIIGVGNGDPSSHEPDKCPPGSWQRSLFNGKCQLFIQSGLLPGTVRILASSGSLQGDSIQIVSAASPPRPFVE
jgi:beta-galactosidase